MAEHLYQHLETLWNYMQLNQPPQAADCLVVLGSNDVRVAEVAAQLYHQKLAPIIVFSGGAGRLTEGLFDKSEAETFAEVARDCGVPAHAIILETEASNTGENIVFSHRQLKTRGIDAKQLLLVQKPYMERRAIATFEKQWPEEYERVAVTSQAGSLLDYINEDIDLDLVVTAMLGDFERIKIYPEKGFQTAQDIPAHVENAYQQVLKQYPL